MRNLGIITFLFSFFLIFLTWNQSFRLDTDYDSNFSMVGRYVLGDPLSPMLNPLYSVPVLIFGTEYGFRITIALVIMFSSLTMWLLLRNLRVTPTVRMWGSLLYATAGTLVARIAAGHIEKVLSYPLVPIFFLALLQKRGILAGVIAAAAFLSGDVYLAWFFFVFGMAALAWRMWTLREIALSAISFLLFSSPKLIPFLVAVQPTMERFFPIHYSDGSIHAFLAPFAFFIPFQTSFYDRPFLQRLLGFHFNWYEYFAFLSPLPLVFLFQKKIWKERIIQFLLFLFCIGALYLALAYPYSPFYWLFRFVPSLQVFRVPQRILFPLTTVVVVLFALAADRWRRFAVPLMAGSLLWTSAIFTKTFTASFESPRVLEKQVAAELRKRDNSSFAVANFVCCIQTFLIAEKISILNYYYGWRPKGSPNFIRADGNGFDYSPLATVQPKYIIGKSSDDFTQYGYNPFFAEGSIHVWQNQKLQ
ncbi:hypothetical protein HY086_06690 [Candidatus Gottesmanbacteria bacterium]|nr:hypothetical protein [Candidatus Gottesmanbacteria bacterium]